MGVSSLSGSLDTSILVEHKMLCIGGLILLKSLVKIITSDVLMLLTLLKPRGYFIYLQV